MEIITQIAENRRKLSLERITNPEFVISLSPEQILNFDSLEEFDIGYKINNSEDVDRLKELFRTQGNNVKKLSWKCWSDCYEMSAVDVIEMLNCFPKLETLQLSSFDEEFKGDFYGELQLPNIKCLSISDSKTFVIKFLTNSLPENSIGDLTISCVKFIGDNLYDFFIKQSSIKRLSIFDADLETIKPLTLLNLESLSYTNDMEDELEDLKFLQGVIKSQPNLTSFHLFNEQCYDFDYVTDTMLADICTLSKLESLSICIEAISPDGIKNISKLSSLKHLVFRNREEDSLETLKEFSKIKNPSLESLFLEFWYEVAAKTYESIGRNCENLKSLTISSTSHRISFFSRTFPKLESLSVRFESSMNSTEFEHVYDVTDEITLPKLKSLKLDFCGDSLINTAMFIDFIGNFTNLENLYVRSKFPFTVDFIKQLAEKLNTIKSVNLLHFEVKNKETFSNEIIDALKLLRSKLKSLSLSLRNLQAYEICQSGECKDENFTYDKLIDSLRGIFELKSSKFFFSNDLDMNAGIRELWDDY